MKRSPDRSEYFYQHAALQQDEGYGIMPAPTSQRQHQAAKQRIWQQPNASRQTRVKLDMYASPAPGRAGAAGVGGGRVSPPGSPSAGSYMQRHSYSRQARGGRAGPASPAEQHMASERALAGQQSLRASAAAVRGGMAPGSSPRPPVTSAAAPGQLLRQRVSSKFTDTPSYYPGSPVSAQLVPYQPGSSSAAGAPHPAHAQRPSSPSASYVPNRPGSPASAYASNRPGSPSAAHASQRPDSPSAAYAANRPGSPSATYVPNRPGSPLSTAYAAALPQVPPTSSGYGMTSSPSGYAAPSQRPGSPGAGVLFHPHSGMPRQAGSPGTVPAYSLLSRLGSPGYDASDTQGVPLRPGSPGSSAAAQVPRTSSQQHMSMLMQQQLPHAGAQQQVSMQQRSYSVFHARPELLEQQQQMNQVASKLQQGEQQQQQQQQQLEQQELQLQEELSRYPVTRIQPLRQRPGLQRVAQAPERQQLELEKYPSRVDNMLYAGSFTDTQQTQQRMFLQGMFAALETDKGGQPSQPSGPRSSRGSRDGSESSRGLRGAPAHAYPQLPAQPHTQQPTQQQQQQDPDQSQPQHSSSHNPQQQLQQQQWGHDASEGKVHTKRAPQASMRRSGSFGHGAPAVPALVTPPVVIGAAEVQVARTEMQAARAEAELAHTSAASYKLQLDDLTVTLQEVQAREVNLKKQALGLIEGNMELIDRIQAAERGLEAVIREKEQLQSASSAAQKTLADELSQAKKRAAAAMAQVTQLEVQLSASESRARELGLRLAHAEAVWPQQSAEPMMKAREAEKQLDAASNKVAELQKELAQQQSHCRQLEASLLESHRASTQSLAALTAATKEHTALHAQITGLSVKLTERDAQLHHLEQERARLVKESASRQPQTAASSPQSQLFQTPNNGGAHSTPPIELHAVPRALALQPAVESQGSVQGAPAPETKLKENTEAARLSDASMPDMGSRAADGARPEAGHAAQPHTAAPTASSNSYTRSSSITLRRGAESEQGLPKEHQGEHRAVDQDGEKLGSAEGHSQLRQRLAVHEQQNSSVTLRSGGGSEQGTTKLHQLGRAAVGEGEEEDSVQGQSQQRQRLLLRKKQRQQLRQAQAEQQLAWEQRQKGMLLDREQAQAQAQLLDQQQGSGGGDASSQGTLDHQQVRGNEVDSHPRSQQQQQQQQQPLKSDAAPLRGSQQGAEAASRESAWLDQTALRGSQQAGEADSGKAQAVKAAGPGTDKWDKCVDCDFPTDSSNSNEQGGSADSGSVESDGGPGSSNRIHQETSASTQNIQGARNVAGQAGQRASSSSSHKILNCEQAPPSSQAAGASRQGSNAQAHTQRQQAPNATRASHASHASLTSSESSPMLLPWPPQERWQQHKTQPAPPTAQVPFGTQQQQQTLQPLPSQPHITAPQPAALEHHMPTSNVSPQPHLILHPPDSYQQLLDTAVNSPGPVAKRAVPYKTACELDVGAVDGQTNSASGSGSTSPSSRHAPPLPGHRQHAVPMAAQAGSDLDGHQQQRQRLVMRRQLRQQKQQDQGHGQDLQFDQAALQMPDQYPQHLFSDQGQHGGQGEPHQFTAQVHQLHHLEPLPPQQGQQQQQPEANPNNSQPQHQVQHPQQQQLPPQQQQQLSLRQPQHQLSQQHPPQHLPSRHPLEQPQHQVQHPQQQQLSLRQSQHQLSRQQQPPQHGLGNERQQSELALQHLGAYIGQEQLQQLKHSLGNLDHGGQQPHHPHYFLPPIFVSLPPETTLGTGRQGPQGQLLLGDGQHPSPHQLHNNQGPLLLGGGGPGSLHRHQQQQQHDPAQRRQQSQPFIGLLRLSGQQPWDQRQRLNGSEDHAAPQQQLHQQHSQYTQQEEQQLQQQHLQRMQPPQQQLPQQHSQHMQQPQQQLQQQDTLQTQQVEQQLPQQLSQHTQQPQQQLPQQHSQHTQPPQQQLHQHLGASHQQFLPQHVQRAQLQHHAKQQAEQQHLARQQAQQQQGHHPDMHQHHRAGPSKLPSPPASSPSQLSSTHAQPHTRIPHTPTASTPPPNQPGVEAAASTLPPTQLCVETAASILQPNQPGVGAAASTLPPTQLGAEAAHTQVGRVEPDAVAQVKPAGSAKHTTLPANSSMVQDQNSIYQPQGSSQQASSSPQFSSKPAPEPHNIEQQPHQPSVQHVDSDSRQAHTQPPHSSRPPTHSQPLAAASSPVPVPARQSPSKALAATTDLPVQRGNTNSGQQHNVRTRHTNRIPAYKGDGAATVAAGTATGLGGVDVGDVVAARSTSSTSNAVHAPIPGSPPYTTDAILTAHTDAPLSPTIAHKPRPRSSPPTGSQAVPEPALGIMLPSSANPRSSSSQGCTPRLGAAHSTQPSEPAPAHSAAASLGAADQAAVRPPQSQQAAMQPPWSQQAGQAAMQPPQSQQAGQAPTQPQQFQQAGQAAMHPPQFQQAGQATMQPPQFQQAAQAAMRPTQFQQAGQAPMQPPWSQQGAQAAMQPPQFQEAGQAAMQPPQFQEAGQAPMQPPQPQQGAQAAMQPPSSQQAAQAAMQPPQSQQATMQPPQPQQAGQAGHVHTQPEAQVAHNATTQPTVPSPQTAAPQPAQVAPTQITPPTALPSAPTMLIYKGPVSATDALAHTYEATLHDDASPPLDPEGEMVLTVIPPSLLRRGGTRRRYSNASSTVSIGPSVASATTTTANETDDSSQQHQQQHQTEPHSSTASGSDTGVMMDTSSLYQPLKQQQQQQQPGYQLFHAAAASGLQQKQQHGALSQPDPDRGCNTHQQQQYRVDPQAAPALVSNKEQQQQQQLSPGRKGSAGWDSFLPRPLTDSELHRQPSLLLNDQDKHHQRASAVLHAQPPTPWAQHTPAQKMHPDVIDASLAAPLSPSRQSSFQKRSIAEVAPLIMQPTTSPSVSCQDSQQFRYAADAPLTTQPTTASPSVSRQGSLHRRVADMPLTSHTLHRQRSAAAALADMRAAGWSSSTNTSPAASPTRGNSLVRGFSKGGASPFTSPSRHHTSNPDSTMERTHQAASALKAPALGSGFVSHSSRTSPAHASASIAAPAAFTGNTSSTKYYLQQHQGRAGVSPSHSMTRAQSSPAKAHAVMPFKTAGIGHVGRELDNAGSQPQSSLVHTRAESPFEAAGIEVGDGRVAVRSDDLGAGRVRSSAAGQVRRQEGSVRSSEGGDSQPRTPSKASRAASLAAMSGAAGVGAFALLGRLLSPGAQGAGNSSRSSSKPRGGRRRSPGPVSKEVEKAEDVRFEVMEADLGGLRRPRGSRS